MPTNLLILPLLAGYLFTHFVYFFRFRAKSLDGNRLILESAAAGAFLATCANLTIRLITGSPGGAAIRATWLSLFPFDYSGTAMGALALGVILPLPLNLIVDLDSAQRWAFKRHADNLLQFLMDALIARKPVLLSLSTRKFYVGWVLKLPNLQPQQAYVRILPVLSGYRDDKTLELRFTVDYASVYRTSGVEPANFQVTLPIAEIRTASYFDQDVYPLFDIEN